MSVEKKYYLIQNGILYFNDDITDITSNDFRAKSLMGVKLGEKATHIGEGTFADNYLTQITFHKKMKVIDAFAFANNRIEKIVFERFEIPKIDPQAFISNPVKLIVVPYGNYDQYVKMLQSLKLPEELTVISDVEKKFNDLNADLGEEDVIYLKVINKHGHLYWKINKCEDFVLSSELKKDLNEENYSHIRIDEEHECIMYTDSHFNVLLFKYEDGKYSNMTYDDFVKIYYDKGY